MSKITSKIKFLDETRLSFKIEDGMLCVLDQYENMVGSQPLPIPIDSETLDADAVYQKAEECGYNIDDMISEIIQDSVIEKHEYDVWLSQEVFIFYSPTKGEWTSEPYDGVFAKLKEMYEEEIKEFEMGADSEETEDLDCPIENNDDSLIEKKDPNFDYGDEDDEEEEDIDYVSQILNKNNDTEEEEEEDDEEFADIEDSVLEDIKETEAVQAEIVKEPIVEKPIVEEKVEEPVIEKKPEPKKEEKQPEKKIEEKKPQNNNQNNQKNNTQPQKQQPENKNNQKSDKEKMNMSQNNANNSTKTFAWNDKAKVLREAVDEVIKYKSETKSNDITDLAKNVVSLIEEKHIDPNNADEKEILYTLALDGKTIIKGLTPIRAGIYKAMLMKELRSLGF